MTTLEFLSTLRHQGITLWAEGNTLRYQSPVGGLTPALRQALHDRKAEILTVLRQAQEEVHRPAELLRPVARGRDLPLSFAQQRLWFLEQLQPGIPVYNIPIALRLRGPLNLVALERGFQTIVHRHEALRSRFTVVHGQPVQRIVPAPDIPLTLIDLQQLSAAEQNANLWRLATTEARRPFDLACGPLMRTTMLRVNWEDHVLLLTLHHCVADGWSVGLLFRELAELYAAYIEGKPSSLPALSIQYADFAVWQRQRLQGEVLEQQLAYWKQHLAGIPPVLDLPPARPRPAVRTSRGAKQPVEISTRLTGALKELSQRRGVTLFMTLLAAFNVLLQRYTGQDDILVGTPIAGRTRSQTEGLIGCFVNTLALRADLSGDPSFWEFLGRIREVTLAAYTHQELPFEKLVEELHPERSLSHAPLFQVMFALHNLPTQSLELPGVTVRLLEVGSDTAKFDVTLSMVETTASLRGTLEYDTDLFDAATIQRVIGHFQTVLQGVVDDPEAPISRLPLLAEAERQQLLVTWNDTCTPYPREACFHELFEVQVERTPDATAAMFENELLTYRELNTRANQLAHYLQTLGVGPEGLVGLYLARSLEMIVGLLGVLKAGAAFVPLDPTSPPERLAFMIRDAQVGIVVTQQRLRSRLPAHEVQVVCLDTDWASIAPLRMDNLVSGVSAVNLAYVIYTSGSTGSPKGTTVHHQGLVNYMTWCAQAFAGFNGHGATVHGSIGFDGTFSSVFAPLLVGQKVVLVPEEHEIDNLCAALRTHRGFSFVKITPAHLELLAERLSPREAAGITRALVVGGESLSGESLAFWRSSAPYTQLINEYGPTEAIVGCTFFALPQERTLTGGVPIGRPIHNLQMYIVDRHLQPVPIGVPGELYIGGVGLARGYLKQPEMTAVRFLPNPFSNEPGARLYKTGDLVRYLSDGNIEFLGRLDHQVKIRGFRIELGEIEGVLRQHPDVRETVVLAREDHPGNKRLVAYVVLQPEAAAKRRDLRHFLRHKLPEYMVPATFVILEALPLTANGKVNRHALPAPDSNGSELETAFVAPRTAVEKTLAEIWNYVLGVEPIGVHDNFFELGGDSILSIQIVARAYQAGLRLTPRQLFQHQTIAELSVLGDAAHVIEAEQDVITGPVPLTPIQHRFFEPNPPDPHHSNQAILLDVPQGLEPFLLKAAVQHLLRHHDALRLRFYQDDNGWQQVNVGTDGTVPVTQMNVSALPEAGQRAAIEAEAARLQASLNLSEGPLLRVALFDRGLGQPGELLLIIHHLAVDRVSWQIIFDDLWTAYGQLSRGETVALQPKTTSFKQWAQRLHDYARSEALRQELNYWLAVLPRQVSHLPVDHPGGTNTVGSACRVSVSLREAETQALLRDVPRAYHTQIQEVLLTALVRAFCQWTGKNSLLVNLEGHGREALFEDVDLSRTVGWFTTLYPMRLEWREVWHPAAALKQVQEQVRRIPNRGIGYGVLRYLSEDGAIAEQLQTRPQAEVSFNYLGQFDQTLPGMFLFGPAAKSCGPTRSPRRHRRHLLDITAGVMQGHLQLAWTYSVHLHQRATIEQLAHAFIEALRGLVVHC
jgi:amino acid adenylation domain-containing protein/non-ribosomal peptide synthase protein (TIGR01720 family)